MLSFHSHTPTTRLASVAGRLRVLLGRSAASTAAVLLTFVTMLALTTGDAGAATPKVIDGFVLIPFGTSCNQAAMQAGSRTPSSYADGSRSDLVCIHVSQPGSTNNINTPATFADANATPAPGAVVTVTATAGILSVGTAHTFTFLANQSGYASAAYRGAGNAATTDALTAAVAGAANASLPVTLAATQPAAARVIDAFVLVPSTTCGQAAIQAATRPGAVPADGSQAWSICVHVSQAGSTNNIDSPATFSQANGVPVGGASVTVTVPIGSLSPVPVSTATAGTSPTGYATIPYRGAGNAPISITATATTFGASAATLPIDLTTIVPTPPAVIDAFVLIPFGTPCTATSIPTGQRPGSVRADGSEGWSICVHVAQATSTNNLNTPATFLEANGPGIPSAVVNVTTTIGYLATSTAQSAVAYAGSTGYALLTYRGAGGVVAVDTITASLQGVTPPASATLSVNLTVPVPAPASVIDAFVLVPNGSGCSQFTATTGLRPGAVLSDGTVGWTMCLHVSQAGSTNNIDSPATYSDASGTPVQGAVLNMGSTLGLIVSGSSGSAPAVVTNTSGWGQLTYRGGGTVGNDTVTASLQAASPPVTATLSVVLAPPPPPAPTAVIDAQVFIPAGTLCNQSNVVSGQRAPSVAANGAQAWTVCLHVSLPGTPNDVNNPAAFNEAAAMPIGGAVLAVGGTVGVLGNGTAHSTVAITNPFGYATASYRGAGDVTAADTVTAATAGAVTATIPVALTTTPPPATTIDAMVFIPTGTACNQAAVRSGQRNPTSYADGSRSDTVCLHVSQVGSTNDVNSPATFLEANATPLTGAVVALAAPAGIFSTGTSHTFTVLGNATTSGYVSAPYRGGGGAATLDVITATAASGGSATLTVDLAAAAPASDRVVDAFVLIPAGAACNQAAVISGQRTGTLLADGSRAMSLCMHVSLLGTSNNIEQPANFRDTNGIGVSGAAITVSVPLGSLGQGTIVTGTFGTNLQGYASTQYRGGGNAPAAVQITADTFGATQATLGVTLSVPVVPPPAVIDAMVLIPALTACSETSIRSGLRPGSVPSDGTTGRYLCVHVGRSSTNDIENPGGFTEANSTPLAGAVLDLSAVLGFPNTGTTHFSTVIANTGGYATQFYRGGGGAPATDTVTAALHGVTPSVSATLPVTFTAPAGPSTRVVDALVLLPAGTGCNQAAVNAGARPGGAQADGSRGATICIHVSEAGSLNDIENPGAFADANATPAGGVSVNVTSVIGPLFGGTSHTFTMITSPFGYSTLTYRGAGNAVATDTLTATIVGGMSATLPVNLSPVTIGPAAVVDALVLLPFGTACSEPGIRAASHTPTTTSDESQGWFVCAHVSLPGSTNNVASPGTFLEANAVPVAAGQVLNITTTAGWLSGGALRSVFNPTNSGGYVVANYRGGGNVPGTDTVTASVVASSPPVAASMSVALTGPAAPSPRVIDAFVAVPSTLGCNEPGIRAGQRPASVRADGSQGWILCIHVSQAGSTNDIASPGTFTQAAGTPAASAVVTVSTTTGWISPNGSVQSFIAYANGFGYASIQYRGPGSPATSDTITASVAGAASATLPVTLTTPAAVLSSVVDALVLIPAGAACNQVSINTGQRPGSGVLADGSQGRLICAHVSLFGSTNNIESPATFIEANGPAQPGAIAAIGAAIGIISNGTSHSGFIIANQLGYGTVAYRGSGYVAASDTVTATVVSAAPATLGVSLTAAGSPPPTVTSVTPTSRTQGATNQALAVAGTGFAPGAVATFSGTGITVHSTTVDSATALTVTVSIAADATLGVRDLTVTNTDGATATMPAAFSVVAPAAPTPSGTNVVVQPTDPATQTAPAAITFSSVTTGGTTTVTADVLGPPPPTGFSVGSTYFDVTTTAVYSGPITICFTVTGLTSADRLFHYEGTVAVDVTVLPVNVAGNSICGTVTSLSPFVVGHPVPKTLVSIAVTPATATVAPGGTQAFVATATYSDSSTANVTTSAAWTSSLPAVATVGASTGVAQGVSAGQSTISAAVGTVSGSALLTVSAAPARYQVCDSNGPDDDERDGHWRGRARVRPHDGRPDRDGVERPREPGSVLPVRVQICDATQHNVGARTLPVKAVGLTPVAPLEDAGNSNPGNLFRFDDGWYLFNLSTRPLAPGDYTLDFTVGTDPTVLHYPFSVRARPVRLKADEVTGRVGSPLQWTPDVSGGSAPYAFAVTGGTLPPGLTLNAVTGAISGTPTTAGRSAIQLKVTGTTGGSDTAPVVIEVRPPAPIHLDAPDRTAKVGVVFTLTLEATGGIPPYTFSIVSGQLPAGLALNAATGVISGTPTQAGTFEFRAKVVATTGGDDTEAVRIRVTT